MVRLTIIAMFLALMSCQSYEPLMVDQGSIELGLDKNTKKSGDINRMDNIPDYIRDISTVVTHTGSGYTVRDTFVMVDDRSGEDRFIIKGIPRGINTLDAVATSYAQGCTDKERGFWFLKQFESMFPMGDYRGWKKDDAQGWLLAAALDAGIISYVNAELRPAALPIYAEYTGGVDEVLIGGGTNEVIIIPMRTVYGRIVATFSPVNATYTNDWHVRIIATKDSGEVLESYVNEQHLIEGFYWSANDATQGRYVDIKLEFSHKRNSEIVYTRDFKLTIEPGIDLYTKFNINFEAFNNMSKKLGTEPCTLEVFR